MPSHKTVKNILTGTDFKVGLFMMLCFSNLQNTESDKQERQMLAEGKSNVHSFQPLSWKSH